MQKKKIMFLCTGNSCRSQMAEGWARKYWGHEFDVYSAGTKKHGMNELAMQVMKEAGVDISSHYSKTVASLSEAIEHIDQYGTYHTECIVSEDSKACEEFLNSVDASCVMVNASSRFNDGGQLGLGAELGISTTKLHAYGPMGAEQMTINRYVVLGEGHTRN